MDDRQHFKEIYALVSTIPPGNVMTYGQVGKALGHTARTVGWAMANTSDERVPWHRVVGSGGMLTIGKRSAVLAMAQRTLLERDGVTFTQNGCVNMDQHQVRDGFFRYSSGSDGTRGNKHNENP